MAFNVRVYGYRGMRQLPNLSQRQNTDDAVFALEEPYDWAQLINVNGGAMDPFIGPGANPDLANILRIEVPPDQAVRYEINTPGRNVAAGNLSPRLSGVDVFPWTKGSSLIMVDAAGFP